MKPHRGSVLACQFSKLPRQQSKLAIVSIVWGPSTPFLDPDSFLVSAYLPESPRNNMKVNDPPLTDMLLRQRRVQDPFNYAPNLGYDYGGRLMSAWLDRGA